MRLPAIAALSAALSLPALADDSLLDKANAKLSEGQHAVKTGAQNLESGTNKALAKARKGGRTVGGKLEDDANGAARAFRKKVGTEK